jgi:hypothetical protein
LTENWEDVTKPERDRRITILQHVGCNVFDGCKVASDVMTLLSRPISSLSGCLQQSNSNSTSIPTRQHHEGNVSRDERLMLSFPTNGLEFGISVADYYAGLAVTNTTISSLALRAKDACYRFTASRISFWAWFSGLAQLGPY